ncbi:hypothetical protein FOVG_13375 [Fusarium oxysporum f. sp. pisi HDV247]|uniref:2EXR domain-containing protein n=1 Tax=Fusarium oxysporum f. sp. pisi HDV247 TaxID=1080344 RepID=W9NZA1_FUSOX|nr:hypothetical protein FOVG_13375 [Fusarium oxysporum f. sp. pisi HDV247]KAJ4083992.1 hypothetical protein NW769_014457 [Fusarium oxysporum]
MPSRTFHLFSKLPIELRLKIWKTSCFPFADHEHGLHYIDLASLRDSKLPVVEYGKGEPMKMTALHPDFKTSPEIQESISHANRSAYMWGVGLWKACKESREVIATHFQLKVWRGTQDKGLGPLDVDESLSKACQLYPRYVKFLSDTEGEDISGTGSDDRDAVHDRKLRLPTCLFPRNKDHGDHFIVMPIRDVFCIKNIGLSSLLVSLRAPHLDVPCPIGQHIIFRHPFNLALEFDSSWNDKLPRTWQTCMRGCSNAPWIYLFNKDAHCGPGWHVNEGAVFHDCDHAYVTVYLDPRPDKEYPGSPKETSAMLNFVHHLWWIFDVSVFDDENLAKTYMFDGFVPDNYIKILIRRGQ